MHSTPSIRNLLLTLSVIVIAAASFGQIGVSITIGPPALPVYEQPLCPGDGYLWTPGYWAYDYDVSDYYWVPGTWVEAPEVGFLWTPGYWGWGNGRFVFNEGYWGPHVGFYGGISYGFGYSGEGYEGGRWDNGRFFYNRSVNNVNITNIHNVYNTTVINNTTTINRVSYNGGNGGLNVRPRHEDEIAAQERHLPPVTVQAQHVQAARSNPQLRAAANQGKPPIAATPRPGDFNDRGVAPAKEAGSPYRPNAEQPRANGEVRLGNNTAAPPTSTHARELQPHSPPPPPNTNNPRQDQKYQQQQERLSAKQNQEHAALAQKQDQEHQRLTQQNANQARQQQAEQQHQQQTQRLEQNHAQQQQKLQSRAQPPSRNEPKPR